MDDGLNEPQVLLGIDGASAVTRAEKKKGKRKKKLYEQYLADSGSDESNISSIDAAENLLEREEFSAGMDINILVHQTVQNIIQSVCLEDEEGLSGFGDHDLICFAAAVKNNSSILSLQIKFLDVSDLSLVPLCRALENHPCLRAIDFSGTHGGRATSKAVKALVCTNSSIIFAHLDDTVVSAKDAEVVQEAVRYNALACPDPSSNPFHLGLLRRIGSLEEKEHRFNEGLQRRAWLVNSGEGFVVNDKSTDTLKPEKRKTKSVGFRINETSKFGGEVCAQFVQGACCYGSRCKYVHPEKSAALRNSASFLQHEFGDSVSARFSTGTLAFSARVRLQSRLRPSNFTLGKPKKVRRSKQAEPVARRRPTCSTLPLMASLWTLSFTLIGCCTAFALTLTAPTR